MAPVIPCYASENSLLRSRREFASKPLLQRRVFRRRRRRSAPILQNSLLFSLLAGNSRPRDGFARDCPLRHTIDFIVQIATDALYSPSANGLFLADCHRIATEAYSGRSCSPIHALLLRERPC